LRRRKPRSPRHRLGHPHHRSGPDRRALSQSSLRSEGRLAQANLADTKIVVRQSGDNAIDITALKTSLLSDFYLNGQEALRQKEEQIRHYNWNCRVETIVCQADHIAAELRAQYPVVQSVILEGLELQADSKPKTLLQLTIKSARALTEKRKRVEAWFIARTRSDAVAVNYLSDAVKTIPTAGKHARQRGR
jgi:hypothetical protein